MNILKKIKKVPNIFLNPFGLEIKRKRESSRFSMFGGLNNVKKIGFRPNTVIDVGVAKGTPELYEVFPNSNILLIEPLIEFKEDIIRIANKYPKVIYVIAAASDYNGKTIINVHKSLDSSSMYLENEDSDVNGYQREVNTIRLDTVCVEKKLEGPFLIKIDVQGGELKVISGAEKIISNTEFIILEISFFEFFIGGPIFNDVIKFMEDIGFVPYDIWGPQYRLLDGAMSAIDIAFVKKEGAFRKFQSYATPEQRRKQLK